MLDSMSEKMRGVEEADSFCWDPHKILVVPQQCSFFVTKHRGILKECNSLDAGYLFLKDRKDYDSESLDTGDKSLQCSRHIDILKFWLYFKANGIEKIAKGV